jgi:hypothetical protein
MQNELSRTAEHVAVPACPLTPRWKLISKRVFQVGFFFFLLKGIVWLVVAFLAWQGLS